MGKIALRASSGQIQAAQEEHCQFIVEERQLRNPPGIWKLQSIS